MTRTPSSKHRVKSMFRFSVVVVVEVEVMEVAGGVDTNDVRWWWPCGHSRHLVRLVVVDHLARCGDL